MSAPLAASVGVSEADSRPRRQKGAVKWHPGHYVTLMSGLAPDPAHMEEVIAEMQEYPIRGAQIRYTWAELEPTRGQYDFSRIERDLGLLAAGGKQLFILLQTKQFGASTALPPYLDDEFDGTFAFANSSGGGRNIKLWDWRVRATLIALCRRLGQAFNAHPALEGLALTETALGQPSEIGISAEQKQQFFSNLLLVNAALRQAFPNTVTMQFTNYPRDMLPGFVTGLRDMGAAMGGPDILLDDPGLNSGVYPYYEALAGLVPLGPSVQSEDYKARTHNGPHDPPAIDELYRVGRDQLHANYLFWTRVAYPNDNPWTTVLEYMRAPAFPADIAGGLDDQRPSGIAT